jgi:hypothetical protein
MDHKLGPTPRHSPIQKTQVVIYAVFAEVILRTVAFFSAPGYDAAMATGHAISMVICITSLYFLAPL